MYLYVFLCSIIFGLATPFWFGYLFTPVRRLRRGADWVDKMPVDVSLPADKEYTIKNLREHSKCGDKIVVPHLLNQWTKDLEGKIFDSLIYGSGVAAALNVVVVLYTKNLALTLKNLEQLKDAIKDNWPFPVFLCGAFIQIMLYLRLVHDQARKYSSVIKEAKPKTVPFLRRALQFFKKKT